VFILKRVIYFCLALTLLVFSAPAYGSEDDGPKLVGTAEAFDELMKEISEEQQKNQGYGNYFEEDVMFDGAPRESSMAAVAEMPAPQAAMATSEPVLGFTEASGSYSATNIQVAGVDEADVIKTDGKYIYHLAGDTLYITEAAEDGSLTSVGEIEAGQGINRLTQSSDSDTWDENEIVYSYPSDFYLDGDMLCLLGNSQRSYMTGGYISYGGESYMYVQTWDISDRSKPELTREFKVEGSLVSSRKIESMLYLVVNHYLNFYDAALPRDVVPLFSDTFSGDVLRPISFKSMQYFPGRLDNSVLIVAALDLSRDEEAEVSSLLGSGTDVYMSRQALYVTKSNYDFRLFSSREGIFGESGENSNIYKFGIGEGLEYETSGIVSGHVLNQYSMDEYNGYFRIATTGSKDGESVNSLTIFDADMKQTGKIDDIAPGEQIYSARYMGDKAFMVTYRTVDPLFAMDLSDPANPKVLGELKIPGYSSYLHPYDDNHLIGFGRDTEEMRTINSKDEVVRTWAENRGLKLSMFDVTDMTKPKETDVESIGDQYTNSDLMYNPKVFLFDKGWAIIAIPFNHYGGDVDGQTAEELNGIRVYEITEDSLTYNGTIANADKSTDYNYLDRVVYIGSNFYSVSNEGIQSNNLADLELIDYLEY
jgi:uncharacterized secreted protein with C-terminal beta-propeller domain